MAHSEYVANKKAPGYEQTRANVKDKSSQAVLDEIKRQKDEYAAAHNGEKQSKDMGEFDEAPGGGTPASGGGRGAMKKNFVVAESPDDPKAIKAKAKGEKVRYMQPRAEDGTFTYNSANGKGLSTEKSRGTTDMPWLAGIDLTFLQKGAVLKTNDPEMGRLLSSITLTAQEMHDAMAIYYKAEGGFAGIVGATITKKGRESKAEKSGEVGKVNQVDTSTLSQNTQSELDKAAASVKKGPFRVGKPVSSPKVPTSKPTPSTNSSFNANNNTKPLSGSGSSSSQYEEQLLNTMGLNEDDKEFDVESIRKDPQTFANSVQFKKVWKQVPKEMGIKPGLIIKNIANGKFKTPNDIKKWLNKHKNN